MTTLSSMLLLANVYVRCAVARLSVTLVHPTQPIKIFGNVSTPFGALAIRSHPRKIFQKSPVEGGFKRKRGSQI